MLGIVLCHDGKSENLRDYGKATGWRNPFCGIFMLKIKEEFKIETSADITLLV